MRLIPNLTYCHSVTPLCLCYSSIVGYRGTGPFVDQPLLPAPPPPAPTPIWPSPKGFVVGQRCSLTRETEKPVHGEECLALPALWTCCCLKALWMVRCRQGAEEYLGHKETPLHTAYPTTLTLSTFRIRGSDRVQLTQPALKSSSEYSVNES